MVTCTWSEETRRAFQEACRQDERLIAIYLFGSEPDAECDLAALFTEVLPWTERIDLEVSLSQALGRESLELMDLRHAPLVVRYGVVTRGDLVYVRWPDPLATFIEQVVGRYVSFEPLLQALYWKAAPGLTSRAGQPPPLGRRAPS
jgi:hypothetical protein